MSERRRARYSQPEESAAIDMPGRFVAAEWMPLVDAGVDPMLRRVYARRLWTQAVNDWGRRNGYDPDQKYAHPEGRRWHDLRAEIWGGAP